MGLVGFGLKSDLEGYLVFPISWSLLVTLLLFHSAQA
jgi:hypothetical protein